MRDGNQLRATLERIDGRGYKAYRDITGEWSLGGFALSIDHVQSDPFAAPSRVSVHLGAEVAGLPPAAFRSPARRIGTAAYLARLFARTARAVSTSRGTGRSGRIEMTDPGQVVLPQTAIQVDETGAVEARFTVGLPARGRRISASEAIALLLDDVERIVRTTLLAGAHDDDAVELAAAVNEDATSLRSALNDLGLVAFIGDGAHLPRRSGVDDRPLTSADVVAFHSPDSLRVTIDTPNAGPLTGMGIPTGITLIAGGGFHGKSTLLRAIQDGVWNHAPGDGRERVVTVASAVKVRAEDGRSVAGVDISPFIDGLPLGHDTHAFTTENASGSTSQAAAIVEAVEAGATTLLVDEDTSATNFMIRDRRMQVLVPGDDEPITPFVDRVRELCDELGVSTVLVVGGAGDYLDVADHVVRMKAYRPEDASKAARDLAERMPTGRTIEAASPLSASAPRSIDRRSIEPRKGRRDRHIRVPDERTLLFGEATIDLSAVEQLSAAAQIRAVGLALAWIARDEAASAAGALQVPNLLDLVETALAENLDAFSPYLTGDLMWFRRFELAAALNRLRTLRVG